MKRKTNWINIVVVVALIFILAACSSKKEKAEEPTGSMVRTFTLVDENGLKSGTLKIDPFGALELYDADGKLLRKHTNVQPPGGEK